MKKLFLVFLHFHSLSMCHTFFDFKKLKEIYPDHIADVTEKNIIWRDGTVMPVQGKALYNQFQHCRYIPGLPDNVEAYTPPKEDPLCEIYEPFLRKMYGNTPQEVEKNLVTVDWMPKVFGQGTYRLKVTKINHINEKVQNISDNLEELVLKKPYIKMFLENPGGGFNWRNVANTNRKSNHSFGIAVDINANKSNYWQWDLLKLGLPIAYETVPLYHNTIPWDVVSIFEKYGFIWGGKWYHYDTMHFEYRPEMHVT